MSFHGVTALLCIQCQKCFKIDVLLEKEPTKKVWANLWEKINGKDNICLDCKKGDKR